MTLNEITCYRCSECNRIYETKPNKCACERTVFVNGERMGAFVILSKGEKDKHHLLVKCVFCGLTSEMHYSNIKRQVSCGCKPLHVDVISLNESTLQYRCRKCNTIKIVSLPIVVYCCEED